MNQVMLMGNISSKLTVVQSHKANADDTLAKCAIFQVATNYKELADFHTVSVWNPATIAYLEKIEANGGIKGLRVMVQGPITYQEMSVKHADLIAQFMTAVAVDEASKPALTEALTKMLNQTFRKRAIIRCQTLTNLSGKKAETAEKTIQIPLTIEEPVTA